MMRVKHVLGILRDGEFLNPRWYHYALIFLVIQLLTCIGIVGLSVNLHDPWNHVLGTDFVSFHTAALSAWSGDAAQSYDLARHHAAEQARFGDDTPFYAFFYPPTFILMLLPLGGFSYVTALLIWLGVTGGFWLATVWRLVPYRAALVPLLGFPAVWVMIGHGQNAFLSAGLLAAGLEILPNRPIAGGFCLGLLSYKPQFLPVILVYLLMKRHGAALVGVALSIGITVGLSYWLFGAAAWRGFLDSTPMARQALENGFVGYEKFQSLFAGLRLYDVPVVWAYGAQSALILGVAICLYRLDRARASWDLVKAGLVLATLLVTPFMLDYDLVILSIPLALLVRRGVIYGFLPWEKFCYALAWVVPAFARFLALHGAPIVPVLLCGTLFFVLCRGATPVRPSMVGFRHA